MAPRHTPRQREAQLAFEALTIEGGLLSPEWLAKAAQLQAQHQGDTDYRIQKGLNLRDEIGRYWRIAQAHWADFQAGMESGADGQALSDRFLLGLLRDSFGFWSLAKTEPVEIAGRIYPIGHRALDDRVPIVIAPAGSGLDTLAPTFGDGGRRRSAFGLAQEHLNADENALWGLASDGISLRLLRDNASLTRPAWIEADLGRIFAEERYADFAALWLLIHETRFGAPSRPLSDCPLETWRAAGREEGTRAREHLRGGVEDALLALGQGFLAHPENQPLRAALHGGGLTKEAYFQQLLRLVYRLIFLLTAEERGLLHPESADVDARARYEAGYGLRRLRDRAVKRSAHDRFSDLWEGLKIVLRGVARGEPRLALPALGGLFAESQCASLDAGNLENRALLAAVFKLSWLREESGLSRVNWRDMGPEELGSVYESLLELVPQIPHEGRGFSFATGDETEGNARRTTGSYYTPDSLVQVLLDSTLEPVVQATLAAHPENPGEALLHLSIVDPASGSGHFLLAAARRLGVHVARLQANGMPSAAEYRHAVRQVVSRCVFGVDLNPMAVELCRVSLWMEAVEPGRPLSFLDSHIQHGNALLGTTPELMAKGIPAAAWERIEADDKKTASLLKKRNRAAAQGQRGLDVLWSKSGENESAEVARAFVELDAGPDTNLEDVAGKETRWEELQASRAFRHQRFVADAWCAAFVWPKPATEPKKPAPLVEAAPTNELWRQIRDGQGTPPTLTVNTVEELAKQYQFFHWHLAFPQVFARGGFDVVLGNPPWDQFEFDPAAFFSARVPEIATAVHMAQRDRLIDEVLRDPSNLSLHEEYVRAIRENEGKQQFLHASGRYPLSSDGRLNTAPLFIELAAHLTRTFLGCAGLIVPTTFAVGSFTQRLFRDLVGSGRLKSFYGFDNSTGIFPAVKSSFRFGLLTLAQADAAAPAADFVFFAERISDLAEKERHFAAAMEDMLALNPNTGTCPVFRWRRDAELTLAIHRRVPAISLEEPGSSDPWAFDSLLMFMTNNLSRLYADRGAGSVPVHEAKAYAPYDHRRSACIDGEFKPIPESQKKDPTVLSVPRYWVPAGVVRDRLAGRWQHDWLITWQDVTDTNTMSRTLLAMVLPLGACGDGLPVLTPAAEPVHLVCLIAALNSYALDYVARQKVGGTHMRLHTFKQLPVPDPNVFERRFFALAIGLKSWILDRVLELTFTAWDLEPFARDVGYDGPPFRWDADRRLLLRAELDAAFFHLYGLSRDDTDYVLDTFPIVRKNDEKAHGEYRTKRIILEIYDALAEATQTGRPYQTPLDPPPADPRVAHPPRPEGTAVRRAGSKR